MTQWRGRLYSGEKTLSDTQNGVKVVGTNPA